MILFTILISMLSLQDIDTQLLQATYDYLFGPEQRSEYDDLSDLEEKKDYFYRFWQLNNSTLETLEENEQFELFQRRLYDTMVFDAFGGLRDGWRTDRGKVYIFFGPPGEVLRSSVDFAVESKTEIWVYTSGDETETKVELVFEDKENKGVFKLLTTINYPDLPMAKGYLPEISADISQ